MFEKTIINEKESEKNIRTISKIDKRKSSVRVGALWPIL